MVARLQGELSQLRGDKQRLHRALVEAEMQLQRTLKAAQVLPPAESYLDGRLATPL